jgi:plasmid stabilization system protein ParE
MVYKIIWLSHAQQRYREIIGYLEKDWSQKEVENFVRFTNDLIGQIEINPLLFKKISKSGLRQAVLTKHNLILYRIENDQIQLLTIFDTRQNPRNKPKF